MLEAERWGDEVFQSVPRRLIDAAFLRDPGAMESYVGDAKLPLPRSLMRPALPLTARLMAMRNKARDESVRADFAALPGQLDRIDGWIAEELLGADRAQRGRSADRLHDPPARDDRGRAPVDRGTPGGAADALLPADGGQVPAGTLPAEWLP